jgi:hypothetical protein
MKNTYKILLAALSFVFVLAACTKEPPLFNFKPGVSPNLKIQSATLTPAPSDSSNFVLRLNWTNPNHATSLSNVRFITQVAMAGTNFASPIVSEVMGAFSDSMQAKVINSYVLANGAAFGTTVALETRVISAFSNNNDMQFSNVIPFTFRAYKIPPKVPLPTTGRLYLVGGATQGGWGNPVPTPTQEFARLDETTFAGVFNLKGGEQYLALPLNGNWDNKYSVQNTGLAGLEQGGDFGFNLPGNFPGPVADGIYKIIFDFQAGKFTVEPFTQVHGLPTTLVVVGGATPDGWTNGASNPQILTQLNAAEWQINSINLKANDGYLILPVPGSWDRKYGVPDNTIESARMEGPFIPEGRDFKSPTVAGDYRINMNFVTERYKLTKL